MPGSADVARACGSPADAHAATDVAPVPFAPFVRAAVAFLTAALLSIALAIAPHAASVADALGGNLCDGAVAALGESHPDWNVLDAAETDIDADGRPEVVMLVEKAGSFGTSKPFWIEDDTEEPTWHVFVYRFEEGGLEPVWMSSSLGVEVVSMAAEGDGDLLLTSASGGVTAWHWDGWGFELLGEVGAEGVRPQDVGSKAPDALARTLTLLVAGDNIAHAGTVSAAYSPERHAFVFDPVYDHVRTFVSAYDVAAVVQETVLVEDPGMRSGFPAFATPATMADALASAGFDVVLCATNHVNDKGPWAIDQTLRYWQTTFPQITVLGIHDSPSDAMRIDVLEKNGIRLALFDYTYGLNGHALPDGEAWRVDVLDDRGAARLLGAISASKGAMADGDRAGAGMADLAICVLHLGDEYAREPSEEVEALVERVIDAGADAVVCSHPHVLQTYGTVRTAAGNEGVVFYSLGNFMAQQDDVATVVGGMASLLIAEDDNGARIVAYDLVPTVSHVAGSGRTEVYLLDDYTDELAAEHRLSTEDAPLTVDALRAYVPDELG